MTLRELLGEGPEVPITALAYDHRVVGPGTLFFCVPGFTRDGHDFAAAAVSAGASALVVARPLGLGVPEVLVEDVRAAMALAAARLHGDPTARLRVAGVTGTNGKTTTTFLIRALMEGAGVGCGLLGTLGSVVGGEPVPGVRTTPEAIDLQRIFAAMLEAGDGACAMEISSHALDLRRADGIHVAAAVFTNLSQDHLDFHGDMETYFRAKRRLFASPLSTVRIACADDPYGRRLAAEFEGVRTFGFAEDATYRAIAGEADASGTSFTVESPDGSFAARVPLPGRFNVLNALAAWATARALGAPAAGLSASLASAVTAPGRFQPVDAGQPFSLIVDYAHKPGALEQVLLAARGLAGDAGRVIVVFGAGGDRDRGKRPIMGEIAARLADVAIVTSDNPRSEPPESIIDAVLSGVPEVPHAAVAREVDRRAAITRAVAGAMPADVVVIAGKGHETGQECGDGRVEPFDDVAVAREAVGAVVGA